MPNQNVSKDKISLQSTSLDLENIHNRKKLNEWWRPPVKLQTILNVYFLCVSATFFFRAEIKSRKT